MEKKKRAKIATGYWHGQDAFVLCRDSGTPACILVGGYTEEEALKVRKLFKEADDKLYGEAYEQLKPYQESIVYIEDPAEWREQNS